MRDILKDFLKNFINLTFPFAEKAIKNYQAVVYPEITGLAEKIYPDQNYLHPPVKEENRKSLYGGQEKSKSNSNLILSIDEYERLKEAELESIIKQAEKDYEKGRYVTESAEEYFKRLGI